MQGEFYKAVMGIVRRGMDGGLTPADLLEILSSQVGEVNCYPGYEGGRCHDLSFFFCFQGRLAKKGWPLSFEEMLVRFVQHMQGICAQKTRMAVIVTDSWNAINYEKWMHNIEAARVLGAHVEIYLVKTNGEITLI
jgi:hypothetical protein